MGPQEPTRPVAVPVLRVRTEDGREYRFAEPFTAGRGDDCAVRVTDALASRRHLQVEFVEGA